MTAARPNQPVAGTAVADVTYNTERDGPPPSLTFFVELNRFTDRPAPGPTLSNI